MRRVIMVPVFVENLARLVFRNLNILSYRTPSYHDSFMCSNDFLVLGEELCGVRC